MNNIKSDMINRDASKEQFIELKKIEIIYSEIISEKKGKSIKNRIVLD